MRRVTNLYEIMKTTSVKLAIFFLFGYITCSAQTVSTQTDTLTYQSISRFQRTMDRITSSPAYQMTYVGIPLIAAGLIIKSEDDHFRSLRNDYLPVFKQHYDDYLQYLPAIAMLGMKTGGIQGRSSWGRMIVSDAFSVAIMASVVGVAKGQTNVTRPDGSNRHSFPSGHTATAFMTATMMSKEYGARSPWYSVGAYSVATATGLTRMVNNKHWLSDVLVGAGVGIISTELGYYLADLLFKEKGIHRFSSTESFDRMHNPSFFGVYLGFNIAPNTYQLNDNSSLKLSSGSNAGLEGAWFLNPYIGIGGRFSAGNRGVILNEEAQNESLDFISTYAGAYVSYPLTSRLLIGSKLLAGYTHLSTCRLAAFTIGKKGGVGLGTGASLTFLAKENLGVKLFLDYNLLPSTIPSNKKCTQILTLGSSVSVAF